MRRLFNALNGTEVKNLIVGEVARSFDQHPDFRAHITFPEVRWKWTLEIEVYPRDPSTIRMQGGAEYAEVAAVRPDGTVDHAGAQAVTVVLESERDVTRDGDPPDKVRLDEGLPVYAPAQSDFGVVDEAIANHTTLDHGPRGLAKPAVQAQIEQAHTAQKQKVLARGVLEGQASFQVRRRDG